MKLGSTLINYSQNFSPNLFVTVIYTVYALIYTQIWVIFTIEQFFLNPDCMGHFIIHTYVDGLIIL